ncbi:MAG: hypothetical protein A2430_01565 [Candidatus Liptonbacteria bacterium RIFOXYC1_FULL_36_8]|uniref:Uncharacterized protein n=3 Tax=Candidatus Liptoniibacteriota TaxID=1817909 RepID=A0A1G2CQG7_9BACT|nr:MAG: hypothetical protein A2604_00140 [Candidatus Liptonbacteria bacterium RIFOXYD1_FULL_36_11]OGZ03452.1 MAG: hypothetical protein A2390_00795 [Candidatus Liptonbacteria bacterium RIFOXYB1_FULL_36_10]OGZ04228.1 MAG: hypothetical protein A2430_01565 [Candidatus Liptonbacteria bacterium RIFOXYC1_FULL_36_8]
MKESINKKNGLSDPIWDEQTNKEKISSLVRNLLSRTTKVEGLGKIDLIHQIIKLLLFGLEKAKDPETSSARSVLVLEATDLLWNGNASSKIKNAIKNLNISIDIEELQKIILQGAQAEAISTLKELRFPRIRNYSAPFKWYIPQLLRDLKKWCKYAKIEHSEIGFSLKEKNDFITLSLAP